MDKLIVFVITALSLNAVMMVQAYAQNITVVPTTVPINPDATVESYTALIVAIGTMVGTVGSIIGVVAVFIRNKKTREEAQQIGLGMVTFGQKTVENTDRIRNLIKAGYYMSPEEAKKFLEENKMKADQLTESVNVGTEQLEVIKDNMPGSTTAKISAWRKTLPHESFDTKPGRVE
jgi:hypothetical protein